MIRGAKTIVGVRGTPLMINMRKKMRGGGGRNSKVEGYKSSE
jgi:hypothetical protein